MPDFYRLSQHKKFTYTKEEKRCRKCDLLIVIGTYLKGYKGSRRWRSIVMAVMLVSSVQGAKGNKGVSYHNATLRRCFVPMLHVMGGGRGSSLFRHPVWGGRIILVYREPLSCSGLSRVYRVYRIYRSYRSRERIVMDFCEELMIVYKRSSGCHVFRKIIIKLYGL
jgi:hypothetical protein